MKLVFAITVGTFTLPRSSFFADAVTTFIDRKIPCLQQGKYDTRVTDMTPELTIFHVYAALVFHALSAARTCCS